MKGRGRTICFIDNSNAFMGMLEKKWRVDWEKFEKKLEEKGEIWQTHFFASEDDPPRAIQTDFYRFLKDGLRWEPHLYDLGFKTIKCPLCRKTVTAKTEKGVDVGVATKMLTLGINKAYDTAILVSGDKDYLETVKFIKNLGLRVEVIGWKYSMSSELAQESSSEIIYFDDIKADVEKSNS